MFKFGNKAETLASLAKFVSFFHLPQSMSFAVEEWQSNAEGVLAHIQSEFADLPLLAVRSSAMSEDGHDKSMAGAFTSRLNVSRADRVSLVAAIEEVISSYEEKREDNRVLVQAMIGDIDASGVITTRCISDGSPYYVFNYDDLSGRTDTVTGGTGAHKAVLIHRDAPVEYIYSPRVLLMYKLAHELENICGQIPLDIEFCIDRIGQAYVLQVRPISTASKWPRDFDSDVDVALARIENQMSLLSGPCPGLSGNKTSFGTMPDWNPAEILGPAPRQLAVSIYEFLVTNSVWRDARQIMGYRALPQKPLMVRFAGIPYIDIRCSLNSFLPASLNADIGDRLVDGWIGHLDQASELHDKIEFEVVQTALDFNFDSVARDNLSSILQANQLAQFRDALQDLTAGCINFGPSGSFALAETLLARLGMLQQQGDRSLRDPHDALLRAASLLNRCESLGTLAFSVFARHAFIGEALLRSARDRGAISNDRYQVFKRSISTVASDLGEALNAVTAGDATPEEFMRRFGHLRPGTYDIRSLRYSDRPEMFAADKVQRQVTHEPFELSAKEKSAIGALLGESGFDHLDANYLFDYIRRGAVSREYSKFVFTRDLSNALEAIKVWGRGEKLTSDDLSFVELETLFKLLYSRTGPNIEELRNSIDRAREEHRVSSALRLSYLIRTPADVRVVAVQRSAPNFVTSKNVEGQIIVISSALAGTIDLSGKIVCIESADPGYDWIFLRDIKGLITKYGGANSHMAIRSAELGVPAAIGCGEVAFNQALVASAAELRCEDRILRFVDYAV
jgi:phosphohistidine swiveling domain-containing protein